MFLVTEYIRCDPQAKRAVGVSHSPGGGEDGGGRKRGGARDASNGYGAAEGTHGDAVRAKSSVGRDSCGAEYGTTKGAGVQFVR